jgi:plastocyanin
LKIFGCLCAVVLMVSIVAGCGEPSSETATPPLPQPTFGQGVVRGKVTFSGAVPRLQPHRNEPCCEGAPATVPDETVVVNGKGELANVLVYLANISASDGSQQPPAVLDQKFCQYVPHVLGVQVGQKLRVTSSDPAPHNVHYNPSENHAANFVLTAPGQEKIVTFTKPEFFKTKCDVHPWMSAWIGVMNSPFFAVSKTDGTFEIPKVPAGQYTLAAWHERFGMLEQPVTVGETGSVEATFEYKAE